MTGIFEQTRLDAYATYELRWYNGILEQKWRIIEYAHDAPPDADDFLRAWDEWRVVPSINDEAEAAKI